MIQEKKFFAPILCTYNQDLTKRWRWEYYDSNNRKKVAYVPFRTTHTLEERQKAANEKYTSISVPGTKQKAASRLEAAFEVAAIDWREKTICTYKTILERYIAFAKNPAIVDNATPDFIYAFLSDCRKKKMSPTTIFKYRLALSSFYTKAIELKYLTFNPVEKTKNVKPDAKSLCYFSPDQIQRVNAVNENTQLRLAIRLLFCCFIRPKEQRFLKIGDINFDYGFIEIRGEISKNKKTEKVMVPDWLLGEIQYLRNFPNSHYVFSRSGAPGMVMIAANHMNNQHKKLLDELKIRGRYALYSWKHTGVVMAVKAGINIKDLQMQLRHHSLDMVNEYLKNLGVMDSEDLKNRFPTL